MRIFCLIALLSGTLQIGLFAQAQIFWQSSVGAPHLQSDNTQSLTSDFVFELGTFRNGFIPVSSNTGEWMDNWVPLDKVNFNISTGLFSGATILTSNDPPFTIGAPVYIWSRNRLAGDVEWALVSRSGWNWPNVSGGGGPNPGGGGLTFFTLDDDVASGDLVVGSADGGGVQTDSIQRDSSYELWLLENFDSTQLNEVATVARGADSDLDGRVNLVEFAVNSDPNNASDLSVTTPFAEITVSEGIAEISAPRFGESALGFELFFSEKLDVEFAPHSQTSEISDDGEKAIFQVEATNERCFFKVHVFLRND